MVNPNQQPLLFTISMRHRSASDWTRKIVKGARSGDKIDARLLLDHTVQGIDWVYIHEKALFDRLLAAQEKMTTAIRVLLAG